MTIKNTCIVGGRDGPNLRGAHNAEEKAKPRKAVDLPEEKETTLGLYVTAKEAFEKWKANPDKVKVLDVRFPEEYVFVGHAEMAWNIPVALISYEPKDEKTVFHETESPLCG